MKRKRTTPSNGKVGRASAPYLLILPSHPVRLLDHRLSDLRSRQHVGAQVNRFGQTSAFNDFNNYSRLFSHQLFMGCLIRTLVWTVCVVGGTVLLSVPIALILNEKFYGRQLARIIIMLPWAVSLTMSGIVWRWALNGQSGMVNATLSRTRPAGHAVEWLATAAHRLPDRDRRRHSRLDPLHRHRLPRRPLLAARRHLRGGEDRRRQPHGSASAILTLPLLRPVPQHRAGAELHLRLQFLPADLGDDAGRSGQQTDILVTWLYKLAFRYGELGMASALSVVMFLILLALTITYAVLAMRNERRHADGQSGPQIAPDVAGAVAARLIIILFPFAVMISTALKPQLEVLAYPPTWLPSEIAWQNFADMWQAARHRPGRVQQPAGSASPRPRSACSSPFPPPMRRRGWNSRGLTGCSASSCW